MTHHRHDPKTRRPRPVTTPPSVLSLLLSNTFVAVTVLTILVLAANPLAIWGLAVGLLLIAIVAQFGLQ